MSGNNQQTGENGAGLWIGCSSMSLKSIGLTLEIFLICTKIERKICCLESKCRPRESNCIQCFH